MTETGKRSFRVAYDGQDFHGFQRQPDVATVSDTILEALRALGVIEDGVPEGYAAAGRTDAGVSALAQTVAFEAPEWLTPAALNSELPAAVRAWASAAVPSQFHATHDAIEREYTYHLHAPGSSVARARDALMQLSGEHDFHNFTPDETGTVRTVSGEIEDDGEYLVITVRAGGFPRQFVRKVVTVIEAVANGGAGGDRIERLLGPEPLDGPAGVAPAPPEPLVLTGVTYPSVTFERDPRAVESLRSVFETRSIDRQTAARVTRSLADGVS